MDRKDVAGVAGLPDTNDINGCDGSEPLKTPAETAGNPSECRTFESLRSGLKKLAIKHGRLSPVHHACHNMLEMTEHLAKGASGEQRRQIVGKLQLERLRLSRLLKAA